MIIHLFHITDIAFVVTVSRTAQGLFGSTPERIIGMQSGQEISYPSCTEEIMAEIQGHLSVGLLRHVLPIREMMLEGKGLRSRAAPGVQHVRMIDSGVGDVVIYPLESDSDACLNKESVMLELIQQMQSGASSARCDFNCRHIRHESGPCPFHG